MIKIFGYILTGITAVLVVFLFIYVIKKMDHLKKLPKWFYILAIIALVSGLAAIGLLIANMAMNMS